SRNTSFEEGGLSPISPDVPSYLEVGKRSKVAGKRKVAIGSHEEDPQRKAQKVTAQESKVAGDAYTPLDVDSDPIYMQHLREISIEKLYNIHNKAYMRQAVLDNVLNGRTQEMIFALHKSRTSCDTIREREIQKDKAHAELEKNIEALLNRVNGLHSRYSRLILEENKSINYEQGVSTLRAKVEGLKSEWKSLRASEIQLLQDVDSLRQNRAAVVARVTPDVVMKLIHSDEMGVLIARLVKASIIHSRCASFKEVAELKKPFVLEEMPGYHPSSKGEYD
ncbi:hypothetical protein Tco_1034530, partial [Tanacetum coccineum]